MQALGYWLASKHPFPLRRINMENEKNESKAKGGVARAESLDPKRRKEIARRAANALWDFGVPQASHDGPLNIGSAELFAAVLPNGKRLLSQGTFLRAIGRSRTPKAGTGGAMVAVDGVPSFLQAEALKPFLTEELMVSTTPIFFKTVSGQKAVGYGAELLPLVAEVYLKFRDSCWAKAAKEGTEHDKAIPRQYQHIIEACDALMRALAKVGIIALIDEATGYQDVRDRQALQEILDKYLRKDFATWAKRFPDEFYKEIFRLRGWTWRGMKINRPQCVARYTTDIVYGRLTKGIVKELDSRNPVLETGRRKYLHTQLLTEDIGHPALAQHLYGVIGLMRTCDDKDWGGFTKLLNRAYPKKDEYPLFPSDDEG
jgi:hypothetical protein